jgi:hypothetical protein
MPSTKPKGAKRPTKSPKPARLHTRKVRPEVPRPRKKAAAAPERTRLADWFKSLTVEDLVESLLAIAPMIAALDEQSTASAPEPVNFPTPEEQELARQACAQACAGVEAAPAPSTPAAQEAPAAAEGTPAPAPAPAAGAKANPFLEGLGVALNAFAPMAMGIASSLAERPPAPEVRESQVQDLADHAKDLLPEIERLGLVMALAEVARASGTVETMKSAISTLVESVESCRRHEADAEDEEREADQRRAKAEHEARETEAARQTEEKRRAADAERAAVEAGGAQRQQMMMLDLSRTLGELRGENARLKEELEEAQAELVDLDRGAPPGSFCPCGCCEHPSSHPEDDFDDDPPGRKARKKAPGKKAGKPTSGSPAAPGAPGDSVDF